MQSMQWDGSGCLLWKTEHVLEQQDQLHANLQKEGEKTRFAWDILLGVMCAGGPMVPELKWP